MTATDSKRLYFPALDGLRTVAFAMVFLAHAFREPVAQILGARLVPLQTLFFNVADQGVALFFVLSGFLITHLLLEEEERKGRVNIPAFYTRRVLRIWPLYYVSLLVGFGVWPYLGRALGVETPAGRPWMYLAFLSNLEVINLSRAGADGAIYTGVTWSVAVEEQFYLVWPLLVAATRRRGRVAMLLSIIVASFLFRVAFRNQGSALYMHSFSCANDLAIGGLMAWLLRNRQRMQERVEGLPLWIVSGIYGFLLCGLAFKDFVYLDQHLEGFTGTLVGRLLQVGLVVGRRTAFSLAFGFVILHQLHGAPSFLKLERFQRLCRMGVLTYGLYLLHPHAIVLLAGLLPGAGPALGLIRGLIALPLSVTLAALSYRYLEMPFLRLKERFAVVESGSGRR